MKNNLLKILLLTLVIPVQTLFSQTDITIGENYTITSKILNGDRVIQVYLPSGYEAPDKKYPVLYILDGQLHFTNGVAIQKSLDVPEDLPEMIVVGIHNEYPSRVDLDWGNRDKYLSYFQNELIPYVDNKFRTTNDRVIFGWESGAAFADYALLNKKQLFNGAIVSNGGYATEEMIDEFKSLPISIHKYLYMVNSIQDIYTIQYSDNFSNLLTEKAPKNLIWKYRQFNDENHETLGYLALYHGLRYYYHDFKPLSFSSIKSYNDFGGISGLEEFFKKRGVRYGFSTEIDNSTKNSLIWLAWNRDDFDSFKFFMTEFEDVLSTNRYASAYWQNRFAQFYLKHGDIEKAIKYFNVGISTYPESSRLALMYSGLGTAFLQKHDKKKATKNYKLAIKIAEKRSDPNLESYRDQLLALKK